MKIDRLYTLSEFIDLIQSKRTNLGDSLIYSYNDFLKQPVTKDRFINEVVKPKMITYESGRAAYPAIYKEEYSKWQQAEDNVIFDCYIDNSFRSGDRLSFCDTDSFYYLKFDTFLKKIYIIDYDNDHTGIKTFNDLAENTKGELKLKNFEI